MQSNLDIYLIGFSVLIFLTIVFLFIRKISSGNELKVKIEEVSDSFEIKEFDDVRQETQKSFDFEEQEFMEIIQNYSNSERRFGSVTDQIDLKKA